MTDTLTEYDFYEIASVDDLPNGERIFLEIGDQPVVNADDEIEDLEERLLVAPTRLPLREAGERVHALGGLFIAAHIDRSVFSVTSPPERFSTCCAGRSV